MEELASTSEGEVRGRGGKQPVQGRGRRTNPNRVSRRKRLERRKGHKAACQNAIKPSKVNFFFI